MSEPTESTVNSGAANSRAATSPAAHSRVYGGRTLADRRADRRQRFLDAALVEFTAGGYSQSSVTSICKSAGLSRRQFYELFDDREAVLLTLYDEIQMQAGVAVTSALRSAESPDRRVLARTAMRAFMVSVGSDPRRAELMFVQIVGVSPYVESRRRAGRAQWMEFCITAMVEFADLDRTPRVERLSTAFVGALTFLVHDWSIASNSPNTARAPRPGDLDEVIATLSDILEAFTEM